jgi:hypothetical protein
LGHPDYAELPQWQVNIEPNSTSVVGRTSRVAAHKAERELGVITARRNALLLAIAK